MLRSQACYHQLGDTRVTLNVREHVTVSCLLKVLLLYSDVSVVVKWTFRAARAGRCATAVKPTDLPERTTAASVRGAYAAWTITVHGEETPSNLCFMFPLHHQVSLSCPLYSLVSFNFLSPVSFIWVFRINNCVGELNQKYFIQFLFYTGEWW